MSKGTTLSQPHGSDPSGARLVLLVPKVHVKAVKSALESHKQFARSHGISPELENAKDGPAKQPRMCVPTTIQHTIQDNQLSVDVNKAKLLAELQLDHLSQVITLSFWKSLKTQQSVAIEHNPLRKALREALDALPPGTLASLKHPPLTVDLLVSTFPDSYSIYHPLLLLPSNSLSPPWPLILSHHASLFQSTWVHIARALHCTHIALNSPIPPSNTPSSAHAKDEENILRSPVNLTPIYGSFGPFPTPQTLSCPSQKDFEDALWVTTRQNGIDQTWAPLYTMFSRGNIKEKARIVHLPSVTSAVKEEGGATAVDLYAGIGYFSFSYRKAGIKRVLCWELNPWSVEGLRRGAALNGWSTRVFTPADVPSQDAADSKWEVWRQGVVGGSEDFWIFAMRNETADTILPCLNEHVLPIRHVNLGLLPVSRLSWPSAVRAVDRRLGGWVHAHENVGLVEMIERRVEVETEFQRSVDRGLAGGDAEGQKRKVQVEHVERVKMYAPGVVHAVFDVYIPGTQEAK